MAAYVHIGNNVWIGLTTDTKPTVTNVPNGARVIEYATDYSKFIVYVNDRNNWLPQSEFIETIKNKTINAADNIITDASAASGDFLKHNGTRFVRNIPKSVQFFVFGMSTTSQLVFYQICPGLSSSTEANQSVTCDYALTVKRVRASVDTNAKTGNVVLTMRDDGADVTGSAVTMTAGNVGEFDSGAISVAVAAGSKINFKIDYTGSGTGSLVFHGFAECEILLQ